MGRDRPQKKKKELCVWLKKKHPPPICCVSSSILQFFEDGGGWGSKIFFWTPSKCQTLTHLSSKILSFSAEKKTCERKTDEQIYTHAAADIYDDGEIRRVVVIAIAIVERILENESRAASSARTIHATSGGASKILLGGRILREEDRRKNNRHPRAPSSLCLSRNKKLNSLRTFRVKSEANDDGEFCTERVSRRFSCARALFCFLQLGLKGEEEPIDTFALYFIQSGKTREFFTERVSLTLSFSLSLFLRARQSPRRFSLFFSLLLRIEFLMRTRK